MATNRRDPVRVPDEDHNLLSLPIQVLVNIMSFLPVLDRIKVRYVSRELRYISETASPWREFVWPDCSLREEKCLCINFIKAVCGVYTRRLSFPQHVIGPIALPTIVKTVRRDNGLTILKLVEMSQMVKILQYCDNVTHLCLPAIDHTNAHGRDPDEALIEAIQKLEDLAVLNVHCHGSFQPYLTLKIPLKELTIHAAIYDESRERTILHRKDESQKSIEKWVTNGFSPPNLNIVLDSSWYSALIWYREYLLATWARWNTQIPAGHVACLKLYSSYKVPLNIFQNAPVFQLQFGDTATLPFVQPSNISEWLLLTKHDDDSQKAAICIRENASLKSKMYQIINDHGIDDQNNSVTDLTELDLSNNELDCTWLVIAYPHLQRLNLRDNRNLRIEDLQVIATCCSNLQGLNISIRKDVEFCLKVWEILSSMKLTHLSMNGFFFKSPSSIDDVQVKRLIALFEQCMTLQALELWVSLWHDFPIPFNDYRLLSHFPSLEYCRINGYKHSICTQDILTTCKKLKYFNFSYSEYFASSPSRGEAQLPSSLISACNDNLQQLCILSKHTDLHDTFMETVSAHGGLIHVVLYVHSVSSKGITTLIDNSPSLLSFRLHEHKEPTENYCSSLSALLGKKFADRKLFTSGIFTLLQQAHGYVIYSDQSSNFDGTYVHFDQWLQNTDLLSLWPPNHFCDLQYDTR